jgi:hypothetical protein
MVVAAQASLREQSVSVRSSEPNWRICAVEDDIAFEAPLFVSSRAAAKGRH